jgi:hypothetical protein
MFSFEGWRLFCGLDVLRWGLVINVLHFLTRRYKSSSATVFVDAEPEPDPTFHFNADPDPEPTFHFFMSIWIQIRILPKVLHILENLNLKLLFTALPVFIVLFFPFSIFWTLIEFFWKKDRQARDADLDLAKLCQSDRIWIPNNVRNTSLLINSSLLITVFFQEPKFHKDLALVLMTELLYGKKALPGDNVLVALLVLIRVRTILFGNLHT